ncbi:MAG: tRNA ligase, partial [Marteilia pararefringens]
SRNEKTTSIQQTASVDLPIFNLNELKLVFGGEDNFNEIKTLLPKSTDLPFSIFAATLDLIDTESSRLKKISILSNFFYSILNSNPNLLVKIIFMMLNRVAEPYENIEFGIGQQLVTKCISQMTGMNSKELQKKLVTYGDLGLLLEAQQMVQKPLIKPKPLLIGKTFNSLLDMARISGDKSKQIKITKLQEILTAAKCTETRYIVRFILLQMRIGVGEKNILAALGRAFAALKYPQIFAASLDEPKSTEQIEVKDLFNECVRNFIIAYK